MDLPTNGAPGRDALIAMIKAQLEEDDRNQDERRDAFLCLAVTIPRRQRARAKNAMGPLLTKARIKGSGRDSPLNDGLDLAAELEARTSVLSTLLVLGCEYIHSSQPLVTHLFSAFCTFLLIIS